MEDPVQKVDVFYSQAARFAESQTDESTKQNGEARAFGEQFVELPDLLSGGDV